jgi:UDP:flavonoid glycosyltransferase YjiC (YdhE family)
MPSRDAEATLHLAMRALDLSGQRGVLLGGWAGIGKERSLPEHVFSVESIPHSWLFPRMTAVVHHGGAGTTGAGLRSGVPSILTPLLADQPSWARQVHALGVGPAPLPFQTLTAERLAEAIREAMTNHVMRQRAAELSRRIQREDGLGRTSELFLQYLDRWGHVKRYES